MIDHGWDPGDTDEFGNVRVPSVRFDSSGDAMAFVVAARQRGWDVGVPRPNGFKDVCHVDIWWFIEEDRDIAEYYRGKVR